MKTFEEASKVIRTTWIHSMHWERRAKNENKEWREIAISDANQIIYEAETKLIAIKSMRDSLVNDLKPTTNE